MENIRIISPVGKNLNLLNDGLSVSVRTVRNRCTFQIRRDLLFVIRKKKKKKKKDINI